MNHSSFVITTSASAPSLTKPLAIGGTVDSKQIKVDTLVLSTSKTVSIVPHENPPPPAPSTIFLTKGIHLLKGTYSPKGTNWILSYLLRFNSEAALCGAAVVCSRYPHNGMSDYATDDTAMLYNDLKEAVEMLNNPDMSKVVKMQELLRDKIGTREKNMKRLVRCLE